MVVHYHGGSTLLGFGISRRPRGRSGGVGDFTAPSDQKRARKLRAKEKEIEKNVRLAKRLYVKKDLCATKQSERANEKKFKARTGKNEDSKRRQLSRSRQKVGRSEAKGSQLAEALIRARQDQNETSS